MFVDGRAGERVVEDRGDASGLGDEGKRVERWGFVSSIQSQTGHPEQCQAVKRDTEPVARELAPVGLRSSPFLEAASRPGGSKLPRHSDRALVRSRGDQ
ncbi:MAG: hypothetical protein C0411_12530 [Pseudomonas sp.]|nr:hypothetical protein [Pseudomonas sp.]TWS11602.1 hypothetical protein FJD35_03120 [Pseudomonas mandelii]